MGVTISERRKRERYAVQKPMQNTATTSRHWLQRTPTEFLQQHIQHEWERPSGQQESRKIRYFSFTIRAYVFRGDKLFLTNRNGNAALAEELTVPTDHFDVTAWNSEDGGPPIYEVHQQEERSIAEHIRTVLSSRYQHPNILQNARFLDEFSIAEPIVQRRVEAKTWGEEETFLCDLELSIVMSKYDGSLGNGPAYRWVTCSDITSSDHTLHFVAGLDSAHIADMYSRYNTCRENQTFQEYCTESVRAELRARWKSNQVNRTHRYGLVARQVAGPWQPAEEGPGVYLFTMTSTDAAMRKDATEIVFDSGLYQIVGRFAVEAVQLKPEIELWARAVSPDGRLNVQWCDALGDTSRFLVLTPS